MENERNHPGDEQIELIQHMMLEVGRIMEDVSPLLAMQIPADGGERKQRIEQLVRALEQMSTLACCARLLNDCIKGTSSPR